MLRNIIVMGLLAFMVLGLSSCGHRLIIPAAAFAAGAAL